MPKGRQSPQRAKTKTAPRLKGDSKKATKKVQSASATVTPPEVDATMNVMEVIALHPGAAEVMGAYGLHCFNCAFSSVDSIEAGARSHGLTTDDIENLVTDLNELLASGPARPALITVTKAAAQMLQTIQAKEGKAGSVLRVANDDQTGFCMEFEDAPKADDLQFGHPEVPALTIIASPTALYRIGGSTIDFRDGRFKLDLAETGTCACNEDSCRCKNA